MQQAVQEALGLLPAITWVKLLPAVPGRDWELAKDSGWV